MHVSGSQKPPESKAAAPSRPAPKPTEEERLAVALRANLKRRKQRTKASAQGERHE